MQEHLDLFGEIELRDLGVDNESARERYVACARVAGTSVILDYTNKTWFEEFDVESLRRQSPEQALRFICSTLQFLKKDFSALDEMRLGVAADRFVGARELSAAWIEEIVRRQVKKLGRTLLGL